MTSTGAAKASTVETMARYHAQANLHASDVYVWSRDMNHWQYSDPNTPTLIKRKIPEEEIRK